MLDILVVLVLGAVWALRWARKNGLFSPLLGSRLDGGGSGCEQIDADLTDEGVPYPQRVPVSLGVLYTSPADGGQGKGLQHLAAFLLHCCRAGVRKVVVHGYSSTCSSSEKELARALEGVLAEYGQDRIRIESHAGVAAAAAQQQHTREREEKTDASCTRVLILPARSGRATMVEAAKELCRSPAPVTTAAVAGVLAGSMLDDLQAVVMVGGTPTLAAFPPWPLRIAELLPVAALPRAKADFVRTISAFGARDIRQGK